MPSTSQKFGFTRQVKRRTTSKVSTKSNNEIWMWVGIIVVILIIIGIACYCNSNEDFMNSIIDKFKSIGGGNNEVKDLDIMFFMSPTCPWCTKAKKVFTDEGTLGSMKVVDVTTEDGKKLAQQYGSAGKGIPNFISKKLKSGTVGFKPSTKELVESLKKAKQSGVPPGGDPVAQAPKMNPQEASSKVQDLQMILFASPSCGWCNKQKEIFTQAGVLDKIEVVDVSTPEGKSMVAEMIPEFRGVPAHKSRTTGKVAVGFKPLDTLVMELS